jgi:Subtilase family
MRKPHLVFTKSQEGVVKYSQPVRYPGDFKDEDFEIKNYTPKKEDFEKSLNAYTKKRQVRNENRNLTINVPENVEFIIIKFHDYFDSSKFENLYRAQFGLTNISYEEFNTIGLFAIVDNNLFNIFLNQIYLFLETVDHSKQVAYNKMIRYIRDFTFYSSEDIVRYDTFETHVVLNIIDNAELFQYYIQPIEKRLIEYLQEKNVYYFTDIENNKIEILETNEILLKEILDNFDIIHSVNSYLSAIVRPTAFNMKEVVFGFDIINKDDTTLPIIGVIDTGISADNPLKDLIINSDESYNLTNTSVFEDSVNHGTGVACFAAIGDKLIPNHNKNINADAKLLSIKIADKSISTIAEKQVIDLIRKAHYEFGIKIFTLTINYKDSLKYNEQVSEYAFSLDNLTFELDILIFISIGNNDDLTFNNGSNIVVHTYPDIYDKENLNLNSPAESYNNITIGAVAGNFENNSSICFVPDEIYPTLYTKTFHVNWNHHSINKNRKNKRLYKPDVVYFGGDFDNRLSPEFAGIKTLSNSKNEAFIKEVGTSYSAPLVANIAAKLLRKYPILYNNMQSIKALIINGSKLENIANNFENLQESTFKNIYGNGIPNVESILFSNDSQCTFILENSIKPDEVKSFEFVLPDYFLKLDRKKGFIKVDATLCYKFKPIKHSHLSYCPIHIAFGLFRNLPLEKNEKQSDGKIEHLGINGNKTENYSFAESWSEDYYYKPKLLSNTQKMSFNFTKKALEEEKCKFKIAINCKLHKLLTDLQKKNYTNQNSFSLVISLTDLTEEDGHGNSLYDNLEVLNNMNVINSIDLDIDL